MIEYDFQQLETTTVALLRTTYFTKFTNDKYGNILLLSFDSKRLSGSNPMTLDIAPLYTPIGLKTFSSQ